MRPLRFNPGDRVRYANLKQSSKGLGMRGPADRSPVRFDATVVTQGRGPGAMNVLLQQDDGGKVVTTWAHCRRLHT